MLNKIMFRSYVFRNNEIEMASEAQLAGLGEMI